MVNPIMNYGSEIWGFHKAPDIERVHTRFLKQLLGVRQQTTNAAVYGELCRFPFIIIRKIRILKYWFRIVKKPGSLMHKVFMLKGENGSYLNDWAKHVKSLLDNLGFSFLWNDQNITKLQLESVIQRVYDSFYQQWYSEINTSSKLVTYKRIKEHFEFERYLECVINNKRAMMALNRSPDWPYL